MFSVLAAGLSLLLHATVLAIALLKTPPPPKPPPKPPPIMVKPSGMDDLKFAQNGLGNISCTKTYLGIGVRSNFLGQVIEVAIGGPAWKAGIRAGDTLYGLGLLSPDSHPLGATVEVERVKEDETTEPIFLKIEKICQV